jgi:hypothetical protein
MKIRGLLILLLVLAILLPLSSMFQSASVPYAAFAGTGQNVVVVAKEEYVFARVVITVQPLANVSNVQTSGGPLPTPSITFPNGTTRQVPATTTFILTLPNSASFPLQYSASGPGFQVSPGTPVSAQILSGENSTLGVNLQVPGIQVYQYILTGDAEISVHVLGVSL